MTATPTSHGVKGFLRPIGRPVKALRHRLTHLRLRWVFFMEGIEGIQAELRHLPRDHAKVLRRYGASIANDANVVGPISLINAQGDFSNLSIGSMVHVGSEVFVDLAERVAIEDRATVSMRACIITHFDVGHGPLAAERPRQVGPVTIGSGAYVGAGAIVLHGVTIGRDAVVGALALVRDDVAEGAVVVGIPAREVGRPQGR